MSDTSGKKLGAKAARAQVCRVAYTLNNTQPVACTIIGDQPLFYMDYECDYEDEGMLDAADFGILETELATLRHEIESFDKFSEEFMHSTEQLFQEFISDKDDIEEQAPEGDKDALMRSLKEILGQSRMAKAYLDFAAEHDVSIVFSGQIRDAHYDRKSGVIAINTYLDTTDQILLAVRELRRHWQHRQGALIHPLTFHPDNAVLVNRIQVADLTVSMIRVAWELQLSGCKEAWERIENSPMADLGRAFAREAFLDFRTLNNGMAAAAVFESWFLSERCRMEDKKLIKQMLSDYQGYVFDLDEAEQAVTPALISALGSMPYGKNYLAPHAHTLMNDPIFTDVRDRSNANFLWFIKFERSFRETEQELQTGSDLSTGEAPYPGMNTSTQDQNYGYAQEEHERPTEIIALHPDTDEKPEGDIDRKNSKRLSAKSNRPKGGKDTGSNVVYLRRWSGE